MGDNAQQRVNDFYSIAGVCCSRGLHASYRTRQF